MTETKVETEPGQEPIVNKESSHAADSSHESTGDESSERASPITDTPSLPSERLLSSSYGLIGILAEARGEAFFIDGSRYQGSWDALGMAGAGSFRMPHDVLYVGQIRDGMHHGQGSLKYLGGQVIDGVWNRGELGERRYTFSDGLVYRTENWPYCRFPDRRFDRSKIGGLSPAGRSLKTEYQPTRVIPTGCYDSVDGVFDPSTLCVTNFERPSKIIRIPKADECEWITRHCRKGGTEPVGYQPWLNENWSSEPPELPYRLPMSTDSPEKWWRRVFTFERDTSVVDDEHRSRPLDKSRGEHSATQSTGASYDSRKDPECLCAPEYGPQPEPEAGYDVCGDRSSEDSSISEVFREVVCEAMSWDDYEGQEEGEVEDLLMTVCCPPKGTFTITRREATSTRSLEREKERRRNAESSGDSTVEESWKEEESRGEWGEAEDRGGFEFDDLPSARSRDESMRGENYSVRGFELGGKEFDDALLQGSAVRSSEKIASRKRSPGRGKRSIVIKQVGPKKRAISTKRPCPPVIDADQLLQRKVGDLLFSPALEAPRSPVYLVRKECDKKTCARSKPLKYDSSKCGVSRKALPSGKKNKEKICKDDKSRKKSSEKSRICSPRKLFVTANDV